MRCRYDDGCTGITNIDFSKGVIKEMMLKNVRQRPRMKWQVMDMTETKAGTVLCSATCCGLTDSRWIRNFQYSPCP